MWFGMWEENSKIFLPCIFRLLKFDCLRLVILIYMVEITWLALNRSFSLYIETSVIWPKTKEAYSAVRVLPDHLNMQCIPVINCCGCQVTWRTQSPMEFCLGHLLLCPVLVLRRCSWRWRLSASGENTNRSSGFKGSIFACTSNIYCFAEHLP